MCSMKFKSGDCRLIQLLGYFKRRHYFTILAVCFGSLSCWKTQLLLSIKFWTYECKFLCNISKNPNRFILPSINTILSIPNTLVESQTYTSSTAFISWNQTFCFQAGGFFFAEYYMPIITKNITLSLISK